MAKAARRKTPARKRVPKKASKKARKTKPARKTATGRKTATHLHRDGSLYARGTTRGGKMDGYWEWFRKDGVRMRSGYFAMGERTGEWTTYDRAGKVYKVTRFS